LTCELRYSLESIDAKNWSLAIPVSIDDGRPERAPVSQRRVHVSGLYQQVRYFFSVRARDQQGALTAVSNCPNTIGGIPRPEPGHWTSGFEGGMGPDGPITAMVAYAGNLVVGGGFSNVGGVSAPHVALFDGSEWHPLAAGLDGDVNDLAVLGNDLYAVGPFEHAGDLEASHVARWDGSAWHAVGLGLPKAPWRVAGYNGAVVAGLWESDPIFTMWDGVAWAPMPVAGAVGGISGNCLCLLPTSNGLLAGGEFDMGANCCTVLLRWDGTTWSVYPGQQPPFIVARINEWEGNTIVSLWPGLEDYPANTPLNLRWNGADWVPLALTTASQSGSGARLGGGIIVAVGGGKPIAVGIPASGVGVAVVTLERDTWLPLGALDDLDLDIPPVGAVVQGHLYVGGEFAGVDGINSPRLIRWDE
jgi:hypothetical protein